jgi:hypothetical protein
VLSDYAAMQNIHDKMEAKLCFWFFNNEFITNCQDVTVAILILNAHKNNGNLGLSNDHLLNVGADLHLHTAFLLTSIIADGSVSQKFVSSSFIPIPNVNLYSTQSDNFQSMATSLCFCKLSQ